MSRKLPSLSREWCFWRALPIVTLAVAFAPPAAAQLSAERIGRLLSETEAARQAIGERPFPSPQAEAENVLKGIEGVVEYLTPRTNPNNLARWLAFLQTEPLAQAIASGADRTTLEIQSERIRSVIQAPIRVPEGTVELDCSIGIALCPQDGHDLDALITHADRDMYQVKRTRYDDGAPPAAAPSRPDSAQVDRA